MTPLPEGIQWTGRIAYLDRDGVLNRGSENYINSPEEIVILDGAADSVAKLRGAGFRVCVVTNQSPVGRGHWTHDELALIHHRLRYLMVQENADAVIDLILYSPYVPRENSWARKPNPGMLEAGRQLLNAAHDDQDQRIEIKFGEDWKGRAEEPGSVLVGDRTSDMEAARNHGIIGLKCSSEEGLAGVIAEVLGEENV